MRVVIYGLSKTGTTALFYKLKNSFPEETICLFEPEAQSLRDRVRSAVASSRPVARGRDVLAKVLPFRAAKRWNGTFGSFDRQILIVRDPRDRLVSSLLYLAYNSNFFDRDDAVERLVRLLRRKEDAPEAVPLLSIVEALDTLSGRPFALPRWIATYSKRAVDQPLAFHRDRPRLFVFHYEDMVRDRFSDLESHLARPLSGSSRVDGSVARVVRTAQSGGWRDWFTQDDVAALAPILQPYLDRYYPGVDWALSERPSIRPDHGSGYVTRIVNERRAALQLPALRVQP